MAKVTITVKGDPHEIRQIMRRLFGGGRGRHQRGPCGDGEGGPRGGWARRKAEARAAMEGWTPWTTEELSQLWGEVSAGARTVLAEIAKRPEGYPNAELQQVLGMPGNAIGGSLSSLGVVSKRFGPKPPLYMFRWDVYRMPPPVAAAIASLSREQKAGE